MYHVACFLCSTSKTLLLYCKTLYFHCILISGIWNVKISLHFNLAFSQCSTSIYQAFDGQTEFLRVFNSVILSTREIRENLMTTKNVFTLYACMYSLFVTTGNNKIIKCYTRAFLQTNGYKADCSKKHTECTSFRTVTKYDFTTCSL